MSEGKGDPVADAAERLEAAVDRLGRAALAARRSIDAAASGTPAEAPRGIPPEAVAALAERLEATLARLREILGEGEEG